jgi:hypothetical protein
MKGDFDLMQAQVKMSPPPPRSLAPEIPEAIEEVMLRALEKKPESRYRTTRSFLAALQEAAAPPVTTSSTGQCLTTPGDGKREDLEDPTLQTEASDSSSARTTQLILDQGAGDDPDRNGSATRTSHRWTRLAAGAALVGLAFGGNVLDTHPRSGPGASGGVAPVASIAREESSRAAPVTRDLIQATAIPADQAPERGDPTSADRDPSPVAEPSAQTAKAPAGESDAKSHRGAVTTPQPAATAPLPPGDAGDEPHAAPKEQRRSSEENPGWVIRRE